MSLPTISRIDAADDHLGRFRSELDDLATYLERFAGDDIPLEDAVFLNENGISVKREPREVDTAVLARLLVFADELVDDAESIAEDAQKLRSAVLEAYRHFVMEGRSFSDGGRVMR